MSELVSIIIPVYNVEKYLTECLNSVVNQTYQKLEIIVIDDGSTDSSGSIIKDFALRDNRIKVLSQKNGGQSRARNYGLKKATGSFFVFVDSDDRIQSFHIEELMTAINMRKNLKLAMCKFTKKKSELATAIKNRCEVLSDSFIEMISYLYKSDYPAMSPTCKIYRKELFDNVHFHEGIIYEDGLLFYEILDQVSEIGLLDSTSYYYRTAENSTLTSKISQKNFDIFKKNQILEQFFLEKYPSEMGHFYRKALNLNDSVAVRCIQDGRQLANELLLEIFYQNKRYATSLFPRKLLYCNVVVYKLFLIIMSKIYSEDKLGKNTTIKRMIGKIVK